MEAVKKTMDEEDPCWKGYEQVGMKKKGGKEVPNCVPEEVQQEGAVPSGESVITVKHRTSGKTLRISANAAAKYRAMGYHFHPTNESVEQIDEDGPKNYIKYRDTTSASTMRDIKRSVRRFGKKVSKNIKSVGKKIGIGEEVEQIEEGRPKKNPTPETTERDPRQHIQVAAGRAAAGRQPYRSPPVRLSDCRRSRRLSRSGSGRQWWSHQSL